MKRLFGTLVALLAFYGGANAQLLYRISSNGLEKPSYIVGTYHLAPAKFVDDIAGAREAMAAVEQVYGEVDNSFPQKKISNLIDIFFAIKTSYLLYRSITPILNPYLILALRIKFVSLVQRILNN